MTTYGTQNQPLVADTTAPNFAVDLDAVSNYAALVGNRKVGTDSARQALTGADLWDGLEWYSTDTGHTFVYSVSAAAWLPKPQTGTLGTHSASIDTVTFPVPFPSGTVPNLQVSVTGNQFQGAVVVPHVTGLTNTGFQIRVFTLAGAQSAASVSWTATPQ